MYQRQSLRHRLLMGGLTLATGLSSLALHAQTTDDVTPQVVGGSETQPYSRPYQVALLMNGQQGCGGTLISPNWVLTAAHCLDSASTGNLTVRVGAHRRSGGDGQVIRVSQIIKHEYWQGANGIRSGYDIAVLRLASAASQQPALLPTKAFEQQYADVGDYPVVSGWGLTYNRGTPSEVLREAPLPVISNNQCSSQLNFNIPGSVICGGGEGGRSACNGDSGGPYAVSANGRFYSIGTVSWGINCQGATAFTRTTSYLDWIEGKTGVRPGDPDPNPAPVASFSATVTGNTADFTNTSTDDSGIASSSWNFGDGSTSSQTNPSHTYSNSGTYTVTLQVTDTGGKTDTASRAVVIGDVNPPGCDGLPTWSVSQSYALGDKVAHKGAKYQAIWWSTGAAPDVYTNVWRNDGPCSGGGNQAPVAQFSASANGLTVSFTDQSSDDNAVVSYAWEFGDGTTSSLQSPVHAYAAAGTYQVRLSVSDAQGLSHSTSKTITVSDGNNSGCSGIPAWQASAVYLTGDTVSHQGRKYQAKWWTQGDNPAQNAGQWQVWRDLGSCQ
ncbi:trypsin-like serine protease [Bowmanella denitrificans]|uniref:trypsin-like serine protease n=1 Tax=Bowmanella denitrificans TaxID=366582 RepID=UPI001FE9C9C8|nr:trypsin-like serine protease [Bowmanella denitrificans]